MEQKFDLNGNDFTGTQLKTVHGSILLIQGRSANLGCGYFSIAPADKLADRFAIVSGVKSFEDMLNARVIAASAEAQKCGVRVGETTGRAALLLMEQN